jgi:hypothetical protein
LRESTPLRREFPGRREAERTEEGSFLPTLRRLAHYSTAANTGALFGARSRCTFRCPLTVFA